MPTNWRRLSLAACRRCRSLLASCRGITSLMARHDSCGTLTREKRRRKKAPISCSEEALRVALRSAWPWMGAQSPQPWAFRGLAPCLGQTGRHGNRRQSPTLGGVHGQAGQGWGCSTWLTCWGRAGQAVHPLAAQPAGPPPGVHPAARAKSYSRHRHKFSGPKLHTLCSGGAAPPTRLHCPGLQDHPDRRQGDDAIATDGR